jgi:uncharacterized Zn-binding protein involved in type VI secretion
VPLISVTGDFTEGHCWPPTQALASINTNVFVNGINAVVVGDVFPPHPGNCGDAGPHPVPTIAGSTSVFINGIPVVRDGDPLGCGDTVDSAGIFNNSVFCEGGGLGPAVNISGTTFTTGFAIDYANIDLQYQSIFSLKRKVTIVRDIFGNIISTNFNSWCPTEPIEPNYRIPIVEEDTGRVFYSYKNIGAPDLPEYANPYLRQPIRLTFTLLEGLPAGMSFDTATGRISGVPSFSQPLVQYVDPEGDGIVRTARVAATGGSAAIRSKVSSIRFISSNVTECT